MPQKYKVFFNHNKVYFVKSHYIVPNEYSSLTNPDKIILQDLVKKYIDSQTNDSVYIICSDLKATWTLFVSLFKVKKAAGGLVVNEQNQYLFIKRKGLWDLPKGHIEKNEKTKAAAIREVTEECGITNLLVDHKIGKTYHTYLLKDEMILKPSTWYLMYYKGSESLKPQTKEGITDAFWVDAETLPSYCRKAFPSILSVVKNATGFDLCASITEY